MQSPSHPVGESPDLDHFQNLTNVMQTRKETYNALLFLESYSSVHTILCSQDLLF